MPGGQGDEFDDDELVNEEEKKVENIEQSKKEMEEFMPSNGIELLNRKEICMVEVWKDGKKDHTIRVIDIWYNSDEENVEGYNVWTNSSKVILFRSQPSNQKWQGL